MKRLLLWVYICLFSIVEQSYALTTAGTLINNQATVTYEVNGNTLSASDSVAYTVDYLVDLILVNSNGGNTNVVAGESQASIMFQLKNEGNKDQFYTFILDENAIGDNFDPIANSCQLFDSSNNDITAGISVAQESTVTIELRCDIPTGVNSGNIGDVIITADSGQNNTVGSDNPNSEDIVLADGTGVTDSDHDGKYSSKGRYVVDSSNVDFQKLSCVLSDPINGVSPTAQVRSGAVMVYVFDIHNTGVLQADDLTVTDTLSTLLNGSTLSNIRLESNVPTTCNCLNGQGNTITGISSSPSNTGSGQNVLINIGSLAANTRACLSFEVTVQ